MVHCNQCKFAHRLADGSYNPQDIVCTYWGSDGLEEEDYCSRGELGIYERDPLDMMCEEYDKQKGVAK